MLKKVISGGQIGVDIAALRAAKRAGLETGGYAPKGFRTKDKSGSNSELGSVYGLTELVSPKYPPRTEMNVVNSDATMLIAKDITSPGERLTTRLIRIHRKNAIGVRIKQTPQGLAISHDHEQVADWIIQSEIETLNVAGNSHKWLEAVIENYLYEIFVKSKSQATQ